MNHIPAAPGAERIAQFQTDVLNFYRQFGRDLSWRHDPSPYGVLVSEVMLQQTQVARVQVKYESWMLAFPTIESLAAAPLASVLTAWQGLGYNRRGMWLHRAAQTIVRDYGGVLPGEPEVLGKLMGIGPNTAASIACFAYNVPVVFIETNIRRVFIHEFFDDQASVADRDILSLVSAALVRGNPREWYYALMDYGSDLARRVANPNRRSRHYTRQSKFDGSARQVRGEILRRLLEGGMTMSDVLEIDPRAAELAEVMTREGLLRREHGSYYIK